MRRWLRLFMRNRMTPIEQSYALKKKRTYATWYAFFAWNGFAFLVYNTIKESYPMTEEEKKRKGNYYVRLWQASNVDVIHVDGIKVSKHYKLDTPPPLNPNSEELLKEDDEVISIDQNN